MSNTLTRAHARRSVAALLLLLCCAAHAHARQTQPQTPPAPAKDPASLSGRVTNGGKPAREVPVVPMPAGWVAQRETVAKGVTDEEGRYRLTNVPPGRYYLTAVSPGYVFAEGGANEWQQGKVVNVAAGDELKDLDFTLVRGGVVTGRVTDARGEPAAGGRVNLVRVRTLEGAPVREVNRFMRSLERTTDDRGVYRSYGLLPGVYVVSAGGRFATSGFGVVAHGEEAPTFYPSATRDATTEVTVRAGEEVGAVDVRLRGERGHAVSGTIAGVTEPAHAAQTTVVNVISADSTESAGQFQIYGRGENEGFSVDGLTDGGYDLVAERFETMKGWRRVGSFSRRVQVRGADVTGLRVTLGPLALLSGRMAFEAPPAPDSKPTAPAAKPTTTGEGKAPGAGRACRGNAEELWAGAAVVARREAAAAGQSLPASEPSTHEDSPNDRGEFTFGVVAAGTYRLDFKLGPGYFVTGVRRGARHADDAASVVRLAQGEQVTDLTVTAAYGAASVGGRVSFPACDACPDARARLYLVPQERERADDVLRYSEAAVEGRARGGEFSFDGIAPGRYTLVALPEPARKRGAPERPAFLDADSRARLRREAETRGTRLTLAPCEQAEGVAVTYAQP